MNKILKKYLRKRRLIKPFLIVSLILIAVSPLLLFIQDKIDTGLCSLIVILPVLNAFFAIYLDTKIDEQNANLKYAYRKLIVNAPIKEIEIKSNYQRSNKHDMPRKRTLYSIDVLNDLDKLIKDAGIDKHGIQIDDLEHVILKNKDNEVQINLDPKTVKWALKMQNSEYKNAFLEFANELEKQEQAKLSK